MHKIGLISLCAVALLGACSKHDPILPGTREDIFSGCSVTVLNKNVPQLPDTATVMVPQDCPYTQDSSNVIWRGNKKIFSGFPTTNFVKSGQKPVCHNGFVYAGLTTGELVKINPKTRAIEWIADIYRASNVTGGAAVLDIIAPVIIEKNNIYVGGLGDAFCRISASKGTKTWCLDIGVGTPFTLIDNVVFLVGTDNNLYAVDATCGDIYWRHGIEKQAAPIYKNKIITVGNEKFDATTGKPIK